MSECESREYWMGLFWMVFGFVLGCFCAVGLLSK